MIPCLILSARGQQIDPLQQQLQQLKQQHEATTHDLGKTGDGLGGRTARGANGAKGHPW
jgi:hypothetical protein